MPIVTTCDEAYWPGLVALHNSFLRHSARGFEFWAAVKGEDFAARCRDRGMNVIVDPPLPFDVIPTSWRYPDPFPLSYWRLLVPDWFPDAKRSIYIDTDSLILQSLAPLVSCDMREHPVAATRSNSQRGMEYGPPGQRGHNGGDYGPMSSLYIFDHADWKRRRVLERCVEAARRTDVEFYTLSQGLLQYVLGDDWHELPWATQAHAGHGTFDIHQRNEIYTLHFMGTNPWDEYKPGIAVTPQKLARRALWRTYA